MSEQPELSEEGCIGKQYNLRMYKTADMKWYKGGTPNPTGIPARDFGVQFGFCWWSAEQDKWICPVQKTALLLSEDFDWKDEMGFYKKFGDDFYWKEEPPEFEVVFTEDFSGWE